MTGKTDNPVPEVSAPGTTPSDGYPAAITQDAGPLADFARRVRACGTTRRLDILHTRMLRTVPVSQRADYIALLNQRYEELSFRSAEAS